ncbi:hypothetical protein CYY_003164 [Polysphondylium violaceum]|uniref:FNIP repeat-containing protein n=1 Tax=Polysphondylium violaceum TaxID=133409 RepID=A0A8J4V1K0_9MYCE|nr:hypothetical protein CYY_003164 [Polysphondylium violaceum]
MTTISKTDLFYLVFRNIYIRDKLRSYVCQQLVINVPHLEYLDNNHRFLALLSNRLEYDIFVRLQIKSNAEFVQYINSPYRHLINDLYINNRDTTVPPFSDCSGIAQGVHRLYFEIHGDTHGKLPDSLTELIIASQFYNHSKNKFLDELLKDLPPNLRILTLPSNYDISSTVVVPRDSSLVDFRYRSYYDSLRHLVVQPPKVFKNVVANITQAEELNWLRTQLWIQTINITDVSISTESNNVIPAHIKKISIEYYDHDDDLDPTLLPQGLESLRCHLLSKENIGHLSNLKKLEVKHWPTKKGSLPPSLKSWTLGDDHPLDYDVLPLGLKELNLTKFTHELNPGVLSPSLTNLRLGRFNKALPANVLPQGLQTLAMNSFNTTINPHAIPNSLTALRLPLYQGTFDSVGPLDNLTHLSLYALNPSLSVLLVNVVKIAIQFEAYIHQNLKLCSSAIQHLALYRFGRSESIISSSFLPSNLKSLKLTNIEINLPNLIPNTCIYFETNSRSLNRSLLPASIKHIKINK